VLLHLDNAESLLYNPALDVFVEGTISTERREVVDFNEVGFQLFRGGGS